MSIVYFSFGSNLGDSKKNIKEAIRLLKEEVVVEKISSFYKTEPIGYKRQPDFYNLVVKGRTKLSPEMLLKFIKKIEKEVGRKKRTRWGPREIDIDILLYDNCTINTPYLKIPHKEMVKRRFVLEPLVEIDKKIKINNIPLVKILSSVEIKKQKIKEIKPYESDNKI